jgi:hypothetical protein
LESRLSPPAGRFDPPSAAAMGIGTVQALIKTKYGDEISVFNVELASYRLINVFSPATLA